MSGLTSAAADEKGAERRKVAALVPRLIEWFRTHARDLPWRRTRDPYAIWVSEIMLQQTQVATVIPYYKRWMRALPDVPSLARASTQRLHKLWEGLGYYRRVPYMHAAARRMVAEHGGQFPSRFEQVLALPGAGRYTAGAICSIAYNQPTPVVDGNVIRVLTRLFGIAGEPRDADVNARLWQLAEALVREAGAYSRTRTKARTKDDGETCSHLNQALMELGAMACTPRDPACVRCPVAGHCAARQRGEVERFPEMAPRPAATRRETHAFVIRHGGRFLVVRNDATHVNGNLWEFPSITVRQPGCRPAVSRVPGLRGASVKPLGSFHHSITRYRIHLRAFLVELDRKVRGSLSDECRGRGVVAQTFLSARTHRTPRKPTGMSALRFAGGGKPAWVGERWVSRAALRRLPFPAAHRRIERMLEEME